MEDRVENWKKFSQHMEAYIRDRTVEKYGVKNSDAAVGFVRGDLKMPKYWRFENDGFSS